MQIQIAKSFLFNWSACGFKKGPFNPLSAAHYSTHNTQIYDGKYMHLKSRLGGGGRNQKS